MLFRFFILNFFNIWLLNQSSMVFCSSSSDPHELIRKYINDFNIIRQQDGWDLDMIYGYRFDEETCHYYIMKDILSEIDLENFHEKIPKINDLIILMYTEYLRVFKHLLNSFVQLCYRYRKKHKEYFIYCSNELRETVKTSHRLVLKLLYVATFLNNANIYLGSNYKSGYKSMVIQIGLLYKMTIKNPVDINDEQQANEVVLNIKRLISRTIEGKILPELDNINHPFKYSSKNSVKAVLKNMYGIDLKQEIVANSVEKHTNLLNLFYGLTVQDGYYNLGFDKVIVGKTKEQIQSEIKGRNIYYEEEQENDYFEVDILKIMMKKKTNYQDSNNG